MIKYLPDRTQVLFAEVPDEISLGISITNCQHHCKGCHSPELQCDVGEELDYIAMRTLFEENQGVTCICFLGDGNDPSSMLSCIQYARLKGFKTCLYTPVTVEQMTKQPLYFDMIHKLDYMKFGPYIEKLRGLSSPTTNQVFMKIFDGKIDEDITYRFQRGNKTL